MPKLSSAPHLRKKKKHYRPPGKKKEGNAAKYITRTRAIHYLQLNIQTFRKLCILRGIYPRVPKKKLEGTHKTYYHMKDIAFLVHDPLLEKFRGIKAYDKKIKKAKAKKNKDLVDRLMSRRPTYDVEDVIRRKYPRFIDALRDLDDSLTMVHLFAALPATKTVQIDVNRIHNCRRLSHEWQAYVSRTHSLRKTFLSVKGIYYQAEVQGQKITWLTPHALQQSVPEDVDYNVLLTFLELHEGLLTFVNFKLYHSLSVDYPPFLDPYLEAKAAELYALHRIIDAGTRLRSDASQIISSSEQEQNEVEKKDTEDGESELILAQLQRQIPTNRPGALMYLVEGASVDDNVDQETKECRSLFKNLKVFLGREVPRESLLFVISAFGGEVSWEGDGSPFREADQTITHQITDRPTQGHIYLSREYVRPQWIFDCVNARVIMPTERYMLGGDLPPHLSPFVDNEAEGYVPEYAETIKRLQTVAKKQVLPMPGVDSQHVDDPQNLLAEGIIDRTEAQEAAEKKHKLMMLEKQYHDELKMELQGISYSESLSKKRAESIVEEPKADVLDAEQIATDVSSMSKVVMSRKKRKLYEAMQISKQRKRANVDLLKERKKKAEAAGKRQ